ncbi:RagB/SusD family nutrient uptake outer membrane protein [Capnocytophaga sp.]|uniref:RagB/SusD family nutrient uptake outer membrane protein n=1 Tax=Capnocytophaga sp. TaxID=44737 RepID=UPI0026DC9BB8|nr:RagB/SusD family nutrient uptake outer membrane protein [Capnocytophaga sp.]MDO5106210.1 RagB/SusD family nutrient uptake outer membrane protein [Capnocytophaga sp.]
MKKIVYLVVLAVTFTACDSFLDIEPKGKVIPRTIDDYNLLLNGSEHTMHSLYNEDILALTADDYILDPPNAGAMADISNPDYQDFQLYTWGEYRFYNEGVPVSAWNTAYENLYTYNKIINEVMEAAPGLEFSRESDKLRVRAEALYGRASEYLFLVNTFAKAYSTTAGTDPGVPIVTKADITQTNLTRASIKEVYDFIINDLENALPDLPQRSYLFTRPNISAAYALLARTHLYKGDYQKASEYASKALESNIYVLFDYNYLAPGGRQIRDRYQQQQYVSRYFGGIIGYTNGHLSDSFKNNIDQTNDKRYTLFFQEQGYKTTFLYYNSSVSVGEMYVTRAECYARLGKKAEAIKDLNALRKFRIENATYTDLQVTDFATNKDLIKFALEERRREMVGSQTRLFDVKRMNLEPDFAVTIIKEFQGKTYTAEPNSGKLVLPIPAQVLKFNPSWKRN